MTQPSDETLKVQKKIEDILGYVPKAAYFTFKGKQGYLPEYMNYNLRNDLSKIFSESYDVMYKNLLNILVEKKQ